MSINQQIGWSQEAILLHKISKELERLGGIVSKIQGGGGGGGTGDVGPGTTNTIARFTGSSTVGDSSITDNGFVVTIGQPLSVSGLATAAGFRLPGGVSTQFLTADGGSSALPGIFTQTVNGLVPAPITVPGTPIKVLAEDQTWIAADLIASAGQTGFFTWKFDSNMSPGASSGFFRANAASGAATTELYINELTSTNQIDMSLIFSKIIGTWTLYIQQRNNATKWVQFDITGPLVDNGIYWTCPVSHVQTGSGGAIADTQECFFVFINQNTTAQSVPNTRTITINGVTQDLSTNRSWEVVVPRISSNTGAFSGNIDFNVDNFEIVRYTNITGSIVLNNPTGTHRDGKAIMYIFYTTSDQLISFPGGGLFSSSNTLSLPQLIPAMINNRTIKLQFRYNAVSSKYEIEFFG